VSNILAAMLRGTTCGVLCLWLVGCSAARPAVNVPAPPAVSPAEIRAADALVDEGCYRCLLEAFQVYERAVLPDQMFSTAVLLAFREKELGLPATGWIDRARPLATPETAAYLDIASAVPWIAAVSAPDFEPPARPAQNALQDWLEWLRASPSALNRYAELAIVCMRQNSAPPDAFDADRPLLQYRVGLCGPSQRPGLDSAFAASPRFAETGYFLARYEMTNSGFAGAQVTRALPLLLAAHEAIPESPTIAVTLAAVWSGRKEYGRALALYDQVLSTLPAQRDALLGRATVLTYLGRPDEAIAAATAMIDLGTWYLGDAYYWRGWNQYSTGKVDAAAADVVEARKYRAGSDLLTLSGMIAYDQQRREDARTDFDRALRDNPANCPARWYLGLIEVDERDWPAGLQEFAEAVRCYEFAVGAIEAEVDAPDLSPEALAQQQADRARRLADNQRQIARSALNAALLAMQVNDRDTAVRFAQVAAGHELTKARAEAILRDASVSASTPSP
jgi:tetratricopeptide (TPR) repeat protein